VQNRVFSGFSGKWPFSGGVKNGVFLGVSGNTEK